jgi:hypothetical protein
MIGDLDRPVIELDTLLPTSRPVRLGSVVTAESLTSCAVPWLRGGSP